MVWTIARFSPSFSLTIEAHDTALTRVWFDPPAAPEGPSEPHHPLLQETLRQLSEYFAGARRAFDLPLDPHGTPFQLQVWKLLVHIPYGETRTYGEVARLLGRPDASRAVGAANGSNPIPIIIPCHRVIGAGGALTGYGGGLDRKRFLLELEGWKPYGSAPSLF